MERQLGPASEFLMNRWLQSHDNTADASSCPRDTIAYETPSSSHDTPSSPSQHESTDNSEPPRRRSTHQRMGPGYERRGRGYTGKPRGRPPGAKNKPKVPVSAPVPGEPEKPKKRGRPLGAKNKPKAPVPDDGQPKKETKGGRHQRLKNQRKGVQDVPQPVSQSPPTSGLQHSLPTPSLTPPSVYTFGSNYQRQLPPQAPPFRSAYDTSDPPTRSYSAPRWDFNTYPTDPSEQTYIPVDPSLDNGAPEAADPLPIDPALTDALPANATFSAEEEAYINSFFPDE